MGLIKNMIDWCLNKVGYYRIEKITQNTNYGPSDDNQYITFEISNDGTTIYANVEEGKEIEIARLLYSLCSGKMKQDIMSVLIDIIDEDISEKIINEWGALDIMGAAEEHTKKVSSLPVVRPLDFFREDRK